MSAFANPYSFASVIDNVAYDIISVALLPCDFSIRLI